MSPLYVRTFRRPSCEDLCDGCRQNFMTSIVAKTVKFATRTIKQYASRTFRVQPIITKSSTFQISQLRQYLWYYSVTQDYNDEAEDQEYPWGYRWQSQYQARYKLGSKIYKVHDKNTLWRLTTTCLQHFGYPQRCSTSWAFTCRFQMTIFVPLRSNGLLHLPLRINIYRTLAMTKPKNHLQY